jgi:N-formylglutamate amidohydrolase
MMPIIYKSDVISFIKKGVPFEGFLEEAGIYIQVNEYVPYVCTAIHAGHHLSDELDSLCLVSEDNRLKEEDPYTDRLIDSFPIVLIAKNSRYEYDLNRSRSKCIYDEAWGESVWSKRPNKERLDVSTKKHDSYYGVIHALILYLEERFGGCVIFDMHSYNWQIGNMIEHLYLIWARIILMKISGVMF